LPMMVYSLVAAATPTVEASSRLTNGAVMG
jgi:hypothetical protein